MQLKDAIELARSPTAAQRACAATWLAHGCPVTDEVVTALRAMLTDGDADVRFTTAKVLKHPAFADGRFHALLPELRWLMATDRHARQEAAIAYIYANGEHKDRVPTRRK